MRRRNGSSSTTLALTAVALSLLVAPRPAGAGSTKAGGLCGFTSVTDPQGQYDQTGEIDGGPLVILDDPTDTDPDVPHTGALTCTIQVGATNGTHASGTNPVTANDSYSITGPTTPAVVAVPETQFGYNARRTDPVWLCDQVNVDDGTWYFDVDPTDPTGESNSWSTDPATARCAVAISVGTPDDDECAEDPVCSTIDLVVCTVLDAISEIVDVPGVVEISDDPLGSGTGPDLYLLGDLFWDCSPYDGAWALGAGGNGGGQANGGRGTSTGGGGGSSRPQPYYPQGTVTITPGPLGQWNYTWGGFASDEACEENGPSVSCTPPPPPSGYRNVCGAVTVRVTNNGTGTVTGTSECAEPPGASATVIGPTTATTSSDSRRVDGSFPWTYRAATDGLSTSWSVECSVL